MSKKMLKRTIQGLQDDIATLVLRPDSIAAKLVRNRILRSEFLHKAWNAAEVQWTKDHPFNNGEFRQHTQELLSTTKRND